MASYGKTIGTTVDIKTVSVDPNRKSLAVFNKHATGLGDVYKRQGYPLYEGRE